MSETLNCAVKPIKTVIAIPFASIQETKAVTEWEKKRYYGM